MFDLTGKTALVTGASQGIGKEIAKAIHDAGATVYVHASAFTDKLKRAAEYIGSDKTVAANLFCADSHEQLFEQTGGVDILVLNASIQIKKPWNEYTEEEFDKHISCNLKSTYFIIQKYYEYMKEKGWGRIITLGSTNQYNNHPELSIYG